MTLHQLFYVPIELIIATPVLFALTWGVLRYKKRIRSKQS